MVVKELKLFLYATRLINSISDRIHLFRGFSKYFIRNSLRKKRFEDACD